MVSRLLSKHALIDQPSVAHALRFTLAATLCSELLIALVSTLR